MGSISNYLENELLDHIMKVGAFSQPTNIYVALSTADPTDDGSGISEPSGNNYSRVQANSWAAASGRATSNSSLLTFPEASGPWGTITHWALFDAITGGNMLAHGSFSVSKAVVSTNIPKIEIGDLDVSVSSGGMSTYLANELLDHVFKVGAYTVPSNIYIALSTANPTDDGSGIAEPSGNNYSRKLHNSWDAAASGATANDGAVTFDTASGSWGTIAYCAIFDAATSGNMLLYAAVGASQAIGENDIVEFGDGQIDITLD